MTVEFQRSISVNLRAMNLYRIYVSHVGIVHNLVLCKLKARAPLTLIFWNSNFARAQNKIQRKQIGQSEFC